MPIKGQILSRVPLSGLLVVLLLAVGASPGRAQQPLNQVQQGLDIGLSGYHAAGYPGREPASLELNYAWSAGGSPWYAASSIGELNQRLQFGIGLGQATQLSFSHSQGDGANTARQRFSGFDSSYFHGGSDADYSSLGASLTRQLGARQALSVGGTLVEADRLESRSAWYGGYSSPNLRANLVQVSRGSEHAGFALDLGLGWNNLALEWQHLQTQQQAYSQQIRVSRYGKDRDRVFLSLRQRHNPLLDDEADHAVMLGYSIALGRRQPASDISARQRATEAREDEFVEAGSATRGLLIGAGAVAAVLAISSGSDSQDSSPRSKTQHGAAKARLDQVNPKSIRENREYGGWVYRTPDGLYATTSVVAGDSHSIAIPLSLVPSGMQTTASLHTHGAFDPAYENEMFSSQDITSDRLFGVDGYLGTPEGKFLWYDLDRNRVVQLGRVATQ